MSNHQQVDATGDAQNRFLRGNLTIPFSLWENVRCAPALCVGPMFRHCVVFCLEEHRYALRLSQVERVVAMVSISPLPKAPAEVLGLIDHHGSVVPVFDVRRRFGYPSREWRLSDHLLLARTTRRTLALPVDEVLGVSELSVESPAHSTTLLPGAGHIEGIVELSGGLRSIHDLEALLPINVERQLAEALNEAGVDE